MKELRETLGTAESKPKKETIVTMLKDLVAPEALEAAKEAAILAQDPTKLHRTAFDEYLRTKAIVASRTKDLDTIETELRQDLEAWREAAKAIAISRRRG